MRCDVVKKIDYPIVYRLFNSITLKKLNLLLCNINLEELENPKKLIDFSLIDNNQHKKYDFESEKPFIIVYLKT
jgi:hypothetical protein